MELRDAVEADAEALAALADAPADVMRNLVHDRTVHVAERDEAAAREREPEENTDPEDLRGFVSYDARDRTVHVTQLAGDADACERLLEEPLGFARRERMDVELLLPVDEESLAEAVEDVGFEKAGRGPRFEGRETVRYRWESESPNIKPD